MRLFVGIPLSPAVIDELSATSMRLQSHADGLRWSTPESWHITLQFLGNTPEYECIVSRLRDLPRLVAETAPDSGVKMKVWRNGATIDLQATLGELPNTEQVASATGGQGEDESARATASGMHFGPLGSQLRRELRIGKDVQGVVITRVDPGSPAVGRASVK